MGQEIEVRINGRAERVKAASSVRSVLVERELGYTPCAVEINKTLVPHREHGERVVLAGDEIEIVTLVGGG